MIKTKICGLKNVETIRTAVDAGAHYIGFVFFEKSPRAVTAGLAAELAKHIPTGVKIVGLFVDPEDEDLSKVMSEVPLDMIQLHGKETPDRVAEIAEMYQMPIIKAIPVAEKLDIEQAFDYRGIADIILFDAKPPKNVVTTLPGGNGIAFDWEILQDVTLPMPWMLSGGLNPYNVDEAIATCHATMVDVSSGVEEGPGQKDPNLISAFLNMVERCS